jgi:hypothetical protein
MRAVPIRATPLIVMAMCGAGACGGAPKDEGPATALRAYAAAIESEDAATLHELLTEDARAETSLERLQQLLQENRAELQEQAAALDELADAGPTARARVRLRGGHTVTLVREDGKWVIEGGVMTAPTLRTPLDAVSALRQALSRRSLPGIMRILARAPFSEVETEIEELLEETEDELALEVEVRGREATVRTLSGRKIILLQESGEWRISDIQ